ncbi:MAG: hypothetical protein C4530_09235 [Desulfobacteraceae bacterium]|nr:MAG: hypothetical protein C4530_09235 [Desulfobacteraceae bacterium]
MPLWGSALVELFTKNMNKIIMLQRGYWMRRIRLGRFFEDPPLGRIPESIFKKKFYTGCNDFKMI